jgi:hypothetical protein
LREGHGPCLYHTQYNGSFSIPYLGLKRPFKNIAKKFVNGDLHVKTEKSISSFSQRLLNGFTKLFFW